MVRMLLSFLAILGLTLAGDVLELNGQKAFDQAVKKNDFLVVSFTAPW
jgi:hypothetical protein